MDCSDFREALSAQLDGEDPGMPAATLEAHVAGCAACAGWARTIVVVSRAIRVRDAERVPDLTAPILAAIAVADRAVPAADAGRIRRLRAAVAGAGEGTPQLIRVVLAAVAAAQLLTALPAVFGNDVGATIHVAHEQGAWGLALGAGLVFAAWRPSRAAAMLPVLAVFVACLGLMTGMDISAGRIAPSAEAPHLMTAFGMVLVWLESHPPHGMRPDPTRLSGPVTGQRAAA